MMLVQESEKAKRNRKVFDYICSRHSQHDLKTQQTDNSKLSEGITKEAKKNMSEISFSFLLRCSLKREDKYLGKLMNVLKTSTKRTFNFSHCRAYWNWNNRILNTFLCHAWRKEKSRFCWTLNHFQFSRWGGKEEKMFQLRWEQK